MFRRRSKKASSTASATSSTSSGSASGFQLEHDRLAQAEQVVHYAAPTTTSSSSALPLEFGAGPSGSMQIEILKDLECPGYAGMGTIQLTYDIPTDVQGPTHPNPGTRYEGTKRRSYIPNVAAGRCLLTRYKYAFRHGHMLLVGHSVTKATDDQVTWSSLPNHTTLKGGNFGFPDPDYIDKANAALDKLVIPAADDISNPSQACGFPREETEISVKLADLMPMPPPPPPPPPTKNDDNAATS